MKTARAAKAAHGAIARKTPRPVATPLPPLNFNHTGKQCPTTARAAAAATTQEVPASSVSHRATNSAAAACFTNVRAASQFHYQIAEWDRAEQIGENQ